MAGKDDWAVGRMDIRHCRGLSDKVALFAKKADEHEKSQKDNPFSASWSGPSSRPKFDKNAASYGKPKEGSKTECRGQKANALISNEIVLLCDMVYEYGERYEDGTAAISFGELFEIYTRISSKVVGILLRARKHGLLTFEGETLFQRRDDDVPIFLLKPLKEIRALFRKQQGLDEEEEEKKEKEKSESPDELVDEELAFMYA